MELNEQQQAAMDGMLSAMQTGNEHCEAAENLLVQAGKNTWDGGKAEGAKAAAHASLAIFYQERARQMAAAIDGRPA